MTSFIIKLFGISLLFGPNLSSNDIAFLNINPPPLEIAFNLDEEITAKSVVIYDLDSESVIYEKNADEKRAMASLTKLMTALLIIENHTPDEVVTITEEMHNIEPAKMWLMTDEKITVANLFRGLLIPSANDAALALAIYDSGSIDRFAEKMNQRAYYLGATNTNFKNPHGLDEEDHYSTARDIALLTAYLLRKDSNWGELFRKTISTKELVVESQNGKIKHELKTTNDLLDTNLPIFGVKTGTTDEAGQCLVTLYKNDQNVLIVVLGSEDRFGDTRKIINAIE